MDEFVCPGKRCIELFSGNGDITNALRARGFNCVSVDYDATKMPDICMDVYSLSKEFLSSFDFIWASPDCTTYSLASHGKHRKSGGVPVSDYAHECDANNERLVDLLISLDVPFIIENPRGHLRNMPWMQSLYRCTVYYARYGAPYSKPTDLFSNRLISHMFDTRPKFTGLQMDYVTQSTDFLGRCKIPSALVDAVCLCISSLILN